MNKKFSIAIIALLFSFIVYSQNHERDRIIDVLNEYAINKQLKYERPTTLGSPYLNKMFTSATISNMREKAMLRYDVFSDEFEFVNSNRDTLVLNKIGKYKTITFTTTNTKYQLENYNSKGKSTTGYLIWLTEKNNFTLFKKQNIIYIREKLAKSGFDKNIPASLERVKDTYYLKENDKEIYEFPSNKKGLIKLFPDKKAEIEAFVKQTNIDFDKESDIIKLVEFLAG
ncbi:MAG: hypothetical protein V4535_06645 [Bacteroidota bacterium]